jgi:prevent-host-death family protein
VKKISISEFKARSLGLIDNVFKSGNGLIITKRGEPIAQVIPFKEPRKNLEPGRLIHTYLGETDIIAPIGENVWNAVKD